MKRERLVPLTEWARKEGISESLARKWIKEGRVEAMRLGHYWYIPEEVEGPERGTQVYTLFTHAGGAGKTSLARDLGFELASRGYRVLLIDADPQANLTAWLGVDPSGVQDEETLLRVIRQDLLPAPREVGRNLHLIPASVNLAVGELELDRKPLGALALRTALERVEGYDLVLVDSLPSLGSLAVMAALAGDGLLVPVETGAKGVQALRAVIGVAKEYREALRKVDPEAVAGRSHIIRTFIPTKYDARTAGDNRVLETIQELEEVAPVAPRIAYRPGPHRRATEEGVPIQLTGDKEAAEEIARLADFLLEQVFRFEEVVA
ncbi:MULTISPECIES: ParA family protein [Thermus]|jgi:chromosome partitioning protein|uniref:Chromosome partitioning protein ParA n=1 Tax=Thermus brockianus TaxID=56956 RepID=A0A1J0LW10_THEBO|nr:ParA family protein [Thermus brockianus]APD10314.1 ParA family chromosome partitioning ATPase [Thermus brockianus]BDG17579.1 chromosome partitioning protein ParA [Thermus brockianus]